MKKQLLFVAVIIFSFIFTASAQAINKDSMSLVKKITVDKEKLTKMQAQIPELTKDKEQTAVKAQESADDNRTAANRLSNDPQDKKLARRADNSASDARDNAKKARKASDKLEDTNKDIRNLTERIAKEETKLNKYIQENKNMMAAPTVIIPKDTIQH